MLKVFALNPTPVLGPNRPDQTKMEPLALRATQSNWTLKPGPPCSALQAPLFWLPTGRPDQSLRLPVRALRLLLPCFLEGLRRTKWSLCNVPIPTKQQNKNRTQEVATFTLVLLQTCGFLYKQEPCISLLPGSRILQGWGLELPSEMCLISINCFKREKQTSLYLPCQPDTNQGISGKRNWQLNSCF